MGSKRKRKSSPGLPIKKRNATRDKGQERVHDTSEAIHSKVDNPGPMTRGRQALAVGIHSVEWAKNIAPSSSRLLKLPLEIRHKIYRVLIQCWPHIMPRTYWQKDKFRSGVFQSSTETDNLAALLCTCKQTYLEVNGSSLFYQFNKFHFDGQYGMVRYFRYAANPFHTANIHSLSLSWMVHYRYNLFPPKSLWAAIDKMPSLQHLALSFGVDNRSTLVKGMGYSRDDGAAVNQFLQLLRLTFENSEALQNLKGLKSFRVSPPWDVTRTELLWQFLVQQHPKVREGQVAFDKAITEIETNLRIKYYSSQGA
ncbi:hypothetical protein GLAREA_07771 [Glarea lozoyensis ATCC 20868]|uniref:Uncharacterized protein n=1 Tax=Glarea lozoyensis (strain ATCC 20868 / MF5171) TaxID=1116229 RepID=S3D274_GLAL2|nr:uncharacterized protein GLAREA_07771 [Glarea lozoyensis ATCC 20868]EPE32637.1 hypothetical protein GLAREA_07771 [Glarea lozoyensis ATCC 20868]